MPLRQRSDRNLLKLSRGDHRTVDARKNKVSGTVASAGYTRLLGIVNQDNCWRLRAARVKVDLMYRLDVTTFSGINLDVRFRRKPLQFVDQLPDFHLAFSSRGALSSSNATMWRSSTRSQPNQPRVRS